MLEQVYTELRALAARHLRRERHGHTLQPTALVHEAWLRLADAPSGAFRDRTHFYAVAARTLRRVLVDHARRRRSRKRGGGAAPVQFDSGVHLAPGTTFDIVAFDDALQALAARYARAAQVVELRCFGGLDVDATAATLGVSPRTVKGDFALARAWLLRQLSHEDPDARPR